MVLVVRLVDAAVEPGNPDEKETKNVSVYSVMVLKNSILHPTENCKDTYGHLAISG